jgi:hypothetical protein
VPRQVRFDLGNIVHRHPFGLESGLDAADLGQWLIERQGKESLGFFEEFVVGQAECGGLASQPFVFQPRQASFSISH